MTQEVGTPDAGTTQSAGSGTDSANYSSFDEMLAAYEADIAEIEAGDVYGNNIVELYDPLNYIGAEGTDGPTWARILMGASEGDISMLNSLNIQIAWLNAGTDAEIEWQWNGGHVPSDLRRLPCTLRRYHVRQVCGRRCGNHQGSRHRPKLQRYGDRSNRYGPHRLGQL